MRRWAVILDMTEVSGNSAAIAQAVQFSGYRAAVLGKNRTDNPFKRHWVGEYELRALWEKGYDLAAEDMIDHTKGGTPMWD